MTTLLQTDSFDRPVSWQELRDRVLQLNLNQCLQVVTRFSSRYLWFPNSPEITRRVNSVNLSLLAKAIVLWADPNGRPLNLTGGEDDELRWLFTAINSLQWYSRNEVRTDRANTLLSFLMRQAYVRNATADHPVPIIARSFAMFHEIIAQDNPNGLDINSLMQEAIGLTTQDLWVLCAAVHFFYFLDVPLDETPWVFSPRFILDSPRATELEGTLRRALDRIARTPDELRTIYAAEAKYQHPDLPDEYWASEFNILRDFPIVRIGEDRYCCPYPIFAFMRGAVGFYFDLIAYYAEIERERNPRNPNPFDNAVSQLLGNVIQRYAGECLRTLEGADRTLSPEFVYTARRNELRSSDWILERLGRLIVLFECKARRPSLTLQGRASRADIEGEIRGVLSRALRQIVVFLRNADGGIPDLARFRNQTVLFVLVLYEPFHFHAIEEIRQTIDTIATELDADWPSYRDRVLFVPLGIRELELAVEIERTRNISIEQQLESYARYRNGAPRLTFTAQGIEIAQHFEEFIQTTIGEEVSYPSAFSQGYWERFCDFMYERLYGESLQDYEARLRHQWIEVRAYFTWLTDSQSNGRALNHWL